MNRREFLHRSSVGLGVAASGSASLEAQSGARAVVVASSNGVAATELAMKLMRRGVDTLEAVVEGVGLVEADPEDTSVGYGGLPNERGVVQLDSSVMHGPTRGAGGVAALENIVHPARVAKAVMENTDHILLVGKGALTHDASADDHNVNPWHNHEGLSFGVNVCVGQLLRRGAAGFQKLFVRFLEIAHKRFERFITSRIAAL